MEAIKFLAAMLLSPIYISLIAQLSGWAIWYRTGSCRSLRLIAVGTCILLLGSLSGLTHEARRSQEYLYPPLNLNGNASMLDSSDEVIVVLGTGFNGDPQLPANSQVSGAFLSRLLEGVPHLPSPGTCKACGFGGR
ncbi:MAG: hypothetical protein R3C49_23685 [Planctomycetaceae bacterium]